MIVIAMDLLDGETLRLSFSGHSLSFGVITTNPRTMAGKLITMPAMSEDQWWASISPQARTWTRKLADLIPHLLSQLHTAVQVTNTDHKLTIQLVHNHNNQAGHPATN